MFGCFPSNVKDAAEGKAPGYTFNTSKDFDSVLHVISTRIKQCMEPDGILIEKTTENTSNGRDVTRLIATLNGGFLVMVYATPAN